ncbi:hypothetical protein LXL04_022171 [Taraxacum kok-saghyz]
MSHNEFTFKLINGVLSDFNKIFKYKFVHLGGHEVDTSSWSATPYIKKWLEQKGFNESQAYKYFEETFNNFGSKLDRKNGVHNWLWSGVAKKVVESRLREVVDKCWEACKYSSINYRFSKQKFQIRNLEVDNWFKVHPVLESRNSIPKPLICPSKVIFHSLLLPRLKETNAL